MGEMRQFILQSFLPNLGRMDPVSKRLMKELVDFEKEANSHPEILSLYPADDDDLLTWNAQIAGLPNTPYEGKVKAYLQLVILYLYRPLQVAYLTS
jgi:peroxin-4